LGSVPQFLKDWYNPLPFKVDGADASLEDRSPSSKNGTQLETAEI